MLAFVWASRAGDVLALDLGPRADTSRLYAGGAMFVTTSAVLAGCLAWAGR
jgi:hypothetical protein